MAKITQRETLKTAPEIDPINGDCARDIVSEHRREGIGSALVLNWVGCGEGPAARRAAGSQLWQWVVCVCAPGDEYGIYDARNDAGVCRGVCMVPNPAITCLRLVSAHDAGYPGAAGAALRPDPTARYPGGELQKLIGSYLDNITFKFTTGTAHWAV